MNATLTSILATSYTNSLHTYYPYVSLPTPNTHLENNWIAAVLGAVLGVVALSVLGGVTWFFCFKKNRKSQTDVSQSGGRIANWVRGVPKADTSVATTEAEENGDPTFRGYYEVTGVPKEGQFPKPHAGVSEIDDGVAYRSPISPRSPPMESGGVERYEMDVLQRPAAAAELATPYHFRDHPLYPRNPASDSVTMSPTHGPRSATRHDAFTPSPKDQSQRRSATTGDALSQPTTGSSQPSMPSTEQSPDIGVGGLQHGPSHKRNASSMNSNPAVSPGATTPDLDALAAVSGLGYSNSRPGHTRNMSSISSGLTQLPSPGEAVTAEEYHMTMNNTAGSPGPKQDEEGRNPFEDAARLQQQDSTAATAVVEEAGPAAETQPLVSWQTMLQQPSASSRGGACGRGGGVTRKQVSGRSAFTEEGMNLK